MPKTSVVAQLDEMNCPKCNTSMTSINFSHDSGIFLKKCGACEGVWVDSGQFELIAQYRAGTPSIQRLGAACADVVRTSNKLQFAQGLLRSRLLSGFVAVGYLSFVLVAIGSLHLFLSMILFLLLPMTCIWFPDATGNLKGVSLGLGRPIISETTPGDVVALCGWLLLVLPLVALWIIR
ncbi:MAG: zf-TFIIB domain-containing protein [Pirellulaceae bacterium]